MDDPGDALSGTPDLAPGVVCLVVWEVVVVQPGVGELDEVELFGVDLREWDGQLVEYGYHVGDHGGWSAEVVAQLVALEAAG